MELTEWKSSNCIDLNYLKEFIYTKQTHTVTNGNLRLTPVIAQLGMSLAQRKLIRNILANDESSDEDKQTAILDQIISPGLSRLLYYDTYIISVLIASAIWQSHRSINEITDDDDIWLRGTNQFAASGYVEIYARRSYFNSRPEFERINVYLDDITDRIHWLGSTYTGWVHIWDHYDLPHFHVTTNVYEEQILVLSGVYRTLRAYADASSTTLQFQDRVICTFVHATGNVFDYQRVCALQSTLFKQTRYTVNSIFECSMISFIKDQLEMNYQSVVYDITSVSVPRRARLYPDVLKAKPGRVILFDHDVSYGLGLLSDEVVITTLPTGQPISAMPIPRLPVRIRPNVPTLKGAIHYGAGLGVPRTHPTNNTTVDQFPRLEHEFQSEYSPSVLYRTLFDRFGACTVTGIKRELVSCIVDSHYVPPTFSEVPNRGERSITTNTSLVTEYRSETIPYAYAQCVLGMHIWDYIVKNREPAAYAIVNSPCRLSILEKVYTNLFRFEYYTITSGRYGKRIQLSELSEMNLEYLYANLPLKDFPPKELDDYFMPTHGIIELTGYAATVGENARYSLYDSIFSIASQSIVLSTALEISGVSPVVINMMSVIGNYLPPTLLPVSLTFGAIAADILYDLDLVQYLANLVPRLKITTYTLNGVRRLQLSGRLSRNRAVMLAKRQHPLSVDLTPLSMLSDKRRTFTASLSSAESMLSAFVRTYIVNSVIRVNDVVADYGSAEGYYYDGYWSQYHLFDRVNYDPTIPNVTMHVGEVEKIMFPSDVILAINSLFLLSARPMKNVTEAMSLAELTAHHFSEAFLTSSTIAFTLPIQFMQPDTYRDFNMLEFHDDDLVMLRLADYQPIVIFSPNEYEDMLRYIKSVNTRRVTEIVIPTKQDLIKSSLSHGFAPSVDALQKASRLKTMLVLVVSTVINP